MKFRFVEEQNFRSAPEAPTPLERMGRGFADLTEGAQQLWLMATDPEAAQQFTAEKTRDIELYEQGRGPNAGVDWWRIAGNVAGATPAMAIPGGQTALAKAAIAGGVGAGLGAATFTPEGGSKVTQTALGGAMGAASPAIASGVAKGLGVVGNAVRSVVPAPQLTTQVQTTVNNILQSAGIDWKKLPQELQKGILDDAIQQRRMTGTIDPEAMLRKLSIEQVGGTPTRGMITRDPVDWTREQNLAKVTESEGGKRMLRVFQENDQALKTTASNLKAGMGGQVKSATQAGDSAVAAIVKAWKDSGDDVTAAYTTARTSFGGGANVPVDKGRLMQALQDFEDVVPSPIRNRLQEFGIGRMGENAPTKAFTVDEGDKLLKLINKRSGATKDPAVQAALSEIRNTLKDAIFTLGDAGNEAAAAFKTAWSEASQRFKAFEAPPVKAAIAGQINPATFVQTKVISGNPKDLAATLNVLKKTPEGEQAIADIKAQTWQLLVDKATDGNRPFSGAMLDKAMREVGIDRLRLIFPEELSQLQNFARAAKAMTQEPAFSGTNRSNTASTLMNFVLRYGKNVPVVGPMVAQPVENAVTNIQASRAIDPSWAALGRQPQTLADLLGATRIVAPTGAIAGATQK